ncbi:dockerin type I domain-containing protein [Ruegeria sp. Ofav3-42]|uniref:dockerin type I domain-containing protein n=1 Tax=Ruegeria sp. Ofav3-42 TaxID=2917759 RepID=UPI001EF7498A|nr:dockerin type I domain-containing protein [Ruegeria sp. Ofav3-42]MCG7522192.1 dockerin type I domain-containing protein [Ruegeria sp. Ofav3-42]
MMLQFEGVVATGSAALDSGIRDTALKTLNGVTYLYSLTGAGGGIAVWKLVDGAIPQLLDTEYFSGTITFQVGRSGKPVSLGGGDQLVLDIDTATGLVGYELNPDGTVGALRETGTLNGGGDIPALVQLSTGSRDLLMIAHEDTGQIATYAVHGDGTLTASGSITARADSMQAVRIGADNFVIAADAARNTVSTYRVDGDSGAISAVDNSESLATLGIATPTAVEVVQAYGRSWVVVAGAQSNSLSVMELAGDGRLIPTDHVLDSLHTRFESVQDLSVIEVDGRVFMVAGGGDDGITLFTMTPAGQLVYLDSFADTIHSGLQNVETFSAARVGDELQILAASQQDAGLTQLTVNVADLGVTRSGFGAVNGTSGHDMLSGNILPTSLMGGAGDDILIAGTGATIMTGGAGADIFVMQYRTDLTTITDFQAGIDRLDLFDYPLMRTPAQLTFTTTAQGARIEYLNETINVISASGGPLTGAQVFGAGFGGPDHIPVDFGDFGGLDPGSSDGVLGNVSINSETSNPSLSDAEIRFTPNGGGTVSVRADSDGRFDLNLPSGSFEGEFDVIKTYSTASKDISALDALQVLRISVGLDPTFGPASPENLIAADFNRDGSVNALDALEILRVAVGLPTAQRPEWVFLDDDADLSGITRQNVSYETGVDVVAVDGVIATDMTSILLGNVEAP